MTMQLHTIVSFGLRFLLLRGLFSYTLFLHLLSQWLICIFHFFGQKKLYPVLILFVKKMLFSAQGSQSKRPECQL